MVLDEIWLSKVESKLYATQLPSLLEPALQGMEAPQGIILPNFHELYKEIFESQFTDSGIRVWTAPIVLWHSEPARRLAWIIPERSQACRTPRSAILRFAILTISHFSAQKWTARVYLSAWAAHKK